MAAKKVAGKSSGNPEKIEVENVNVPGHVTRVDKAKYMAMKKALLKMLPRKSPGLTQKEMREHVVAHLDDDLYPGGANQGWLVGQDRAARSRSQGQRCSGRNQATALVSDVGDFRGDIPSSPRRSQSSSSFS